MRTLFWFLLNRPNSNVMLRRILTSENCNVKHLDCKQTEAVLQDVAHNHYTATGFHVRPRILPHILHSMILKIRM